VRTTIETIVTPLTLVIAVNEGGGAEGTLYLDDGVTFNCTIGVYLHRLAIYEQGVLNWQKVSAKEMKIPAFLEKAIVDTIIIYSESGVNTYDGLNLSVSGEWQWKPKNSGRSSKFGASSDA
jgi:hypothetical protein